MAGAPKGSKGSSKFTVGWAEDKEEREKEGRNWWELGKERIQWQLHTGSYFPFSCLPGTWLSSDLSQPYSWHRSEETHTESNSLKKTCKNYIKIFIYIMQAVWSHSYHGIQHMAISNNMAGYRIGIVFLVLSYYLYKPATKSEHYLFKSAFNDKFKHSYLFIGKT